MNDLNGIGKGLTWDPYGENGEKPKSLPLCCPWMQSREMAKERITEMNFMALRSRTEKGKNPTEFNVINNYN